MDNRYETSVELYYKDMQNLIEYEDGFIPADNVQDNADNHFTSGKGNSYRQHPKNSMKFHVNH